MESTAIIIQGKTYDAGVDLWVDERGAHYVKNEFDPERPIFICVSGSEWRSNRHYINWQQLGLPDAINTAFQQAIKEKMSVNSASYLNKCRLMLAETAKEFQRITTLSELDMSDIVRIWGRLTVSYRPFFRELYTWMANNGSGGASRAIAMKLKEFKARNEVRLLKDVLNWHPTRGSLTREEDDLLSNALEVYQPKNLKRLTSKLLCCIFSATLKRSKQVLSLRPDCLKAVTQNSHTEHFVLIRPVKEQTGDPDRWWPISEKLYQEMQRYKLDPAVRAWQKQHGLFWFLDVPSVYEDGTIDAGTTKGLLQHFVANILGIVSPRTGKSLHVTPHRLRHTGATLLAFNGVPRDIIAEILEHDNADSCQAYIDAIGSELCPSIDRADRNMGGLFGVLAKAYFQGELVDDLLEQPVLLPVFDEPVPLYVGSCGRDTCSEGRCTKHPFVDCYNGCPNFLAWREADHQRALAYADSELDRWQAADRPESKSTIQEFEKLRANIVRVMERITEEGEGAVK